MTNQRAGELLAKILLSRHQDYIAGIVRQLENPDLPLPEIQGFVQRIVSDPEMGHLLLGLSAGDMNARIQTAMTIVRVQMGKRN